MATIDQLSTALRNAHNAGDVEAATKLAGAIKTLRANQASHPEFDGSNIPGYDPKTGEVARSSVLGAAGQGAADVATWGFGDEIASTIAAPFSDKSRDEILREMRGIQDDAWEEHPAAYIAGGVGAGIGSGVALAKNGLSLAANAAQKGQGLLRTAVGSAADGAIAGAVHGAGSGKDLEDRAFKSGVGLVGGGALGLGAPYAVAGVSEAARALAAPALARLRPEAYANSALGAAIERSGLNVDDITNRLAQAQADGLPFMVADAMGHQGQRLASTVARNPNEQRQALVELLEARQAGQGRRVSSALEDGFGSPKTALQQEAADRASRRAAGAINYGQARAEASPVDVRAAIEAIDSVVPSHVEGVRDGSVYSTIKQARQYLAPNSAYLTDNAASKPAREGISVEEALMRLNRRNSSQERNVLNQLAPSGGKRPPKPLRLSEFVSSRGGMIDHQGDAAAVAGGIKNRFGRLVRDDAKTSMDYMREAAEEAGYLRQYTNDEFGRASVDDFLKALDDDLRGAPVYAEENMSEAAALEAWEATQAIRGTTRDNLDRISQELPGRVDDDVVNRAARLMESDRLGADEALQRAIADDVFENGVPPQEVPPWMFGGPQNARTPVDPILDFDRAHMAKIEMDGIIEGGGTTANLLRPARDALDDALAASSKPYAHARDTYRQQSKAIEAIGTGRDAAKRGRIEDTIPRFRSMTPAEQGGFRAGYVDPLIESVQSAAGTGTNKVRPLISDASAAEFPEFAQAGKGDRLMRQIAGENEMFATRNAALGGSKTADNLADASEMANFDPTVMMNLLSGRPLAAATNAVARALNEGKGMPASVLSRVGKAIMEADPKIAKELLSRGAQKSSDETKRRAVATAILNRLSGVGMGYLPAP